MKLLNEKLNQSYFPHPVFSFLFVLYWLVGLFILFSTAQGGVLLWLNSFSNWGLDHFFLFVTLLGNGLFALIVLVFLLFWKLYYGFVLGTVLIFVGLFTNLLKRLVFFQHYRPLWELYYSDLYRIVPDAPVNYLHSFPSGHTMTAFALATILSVLFKQKWLSVFLFAMAVLISLSRIYLCQHFFVDTFWGAVIGYFAAILGKYLFDCSLKWFKSDFMALSLQKLVVTVKSRMKH